MLNPKDDTPLIFELVDLHLRQREVVDSLSDEFKNYLIFQFAKKLEISFENYMYKELTHHK